VHEVVDWFAGRNFTTEYVGAAWRRGSQLPSLGIIAVDTLQYELHDMRTSRMRLGRYIYLQSRRGNVRSGVEGC
jgi:hypothetical protein